MNVNSALKGVGAYKAYRYYLKHADWPRNTQAYLRERMGLERRSTSGSVLGGVAFFALGVLVGSAMGVMFAPMTGSDMRSTLREQGVKGFMDKSRAASSTPMA